MLEPDSNLRLPYTRPEVGQFVQVRQRTFFPVQLDDEDVGTEDTGRRKTRKYRYRWPNEIQNEVLARLLDLNTARAVAEQGGKTTG